MMQSQNQGLCRKLQALENEIQGLRLDGERRVRQAQEEQAALAHRLAAMQSSDVHEVCLSLLLCLSSIALITTVLSIVSLLMILCKGFKTVDVEVGFIYIYTFQNFGE